ncbi:MAG: hypothetical protein WDM91_13825 [Rhizomicrobium sp.]
MTGLRTALALCAALILAGCYPPTTSRPVGTTAGLRNDPALTGTWRTLPLADDRGGTYFHFLPEGDDRFVVAVVPAHGEAGDLVVATVSSARYGRFGFLNARLLETAGKRESEQPPGTVPILYRFDAKGVLSLAMMDEDATKAAIRAHKIAGSAGKAGTDDATITADSRTLDKFLSSPAGQALFAKPFGVMKKVD